MRNSIRRSDGDEALRSAIAACSSAAQRTASTTLTNSASSPSPVVLNMRPRFAVILGSISSSRSALSRLRSLLRRLRSAGYSRRHPPRGSPLAGGSGSCRLPLLPIYRGAAACEVAQHRVRQKPFAVPLRQPVAQLEKRPGAEHVDVGERAAGPRREPPAEQCPDIGI